MPITPKTGSLFHADLQLSFTMLADGTISQAIKVGLPKAPGLSLPPDCSCPAACDGPPRSSPRSPRNSGYGKASGCDRGHIRLR